MSEEARRDPGRGGCSPVNVCLRIVNNRQCLNPPVSGEKYCKEHMIKARQIAFYGKGGIGKSTIVANVSAILAKIGKKVMQIGCDPKHDSTRMLLGGVIQRTVLDEMRECGNQLIDLKTIMHEGYAGVRCVEAGGPEPGVGCAGRGIITAIELLEELGGYDSDLDFVFYDVLGDVVCGGFAMPIREGYAKEIYIVASGEMMALYAANNICKGIARFASSGEARLSGIICNERMVDNEKKLLEAFSERVNSKLIAFIPRDNTIHRAEIHKKVVVEYAPESRISKIFQELAENIISNQEGTIPTPMTQIELEEMMLKYGIID